MFVCILYQIEMFHDIYIYMSVHTSTQPQFSYFILTIQIHYTINLLTLYRGVDGVAG